MIEILDFKNETLPLKDRRTAFVLDFLNHFNSNNRGVNKIPNTISCSYTKGCAIGRFLPEDYAIELDAMESDWGVSFNSDPRTPNWLRSLGQAFLLKIQKIHDEEENFDEHGAFRGTCHTLNGEEVVIPVISEKLEEINLKRISND